MGYGHSGLDGYWWFSACVGGVMLVWASMLVAGRWWQGSGECAYWPPVVGTRGGSWGPSLGVRAIFAGFEFGHFGFPVALSAGEFGSWASSALTGLRVRC